MQTFSRFYFYFERARGSCKRPPKALLECKKITMQLLVTLTKASCCGKKRFCFGDRQMQHCNRNRTELGAWAYHSYFANLVGPVTIASMLAQLPPFASASAPDETGNRQHATARSSSSLNRIWSGGQHAHRHMHT